MNFDPKLTDSMRSLSEETIAFAERIQSVWIDNGDQDANGWQRRYLQSMLIGAVRSAKSYWILREAGQVFDAKVISRLLLERIVHSHLASQDPTIAVELIISDIRQAQNGLKKFGEMQPERDFREKIQAQEDSLDTLRGLPGVSQTARKWDDVRDRFKAAKLPQLHRSLYKILSASVHADYHSALERSGFLPPCDYIACMAPLDTAGLVHAISCSEQDCNIGAECLELQTRSGELLSSVQMDA